MRFRGLILIAAVGLTAGTSQAATVLSISPSSGTPTRAVTISGTGFGASEAVDLYVDTVDTLLLVSSATGTISTSVTVPAIEQPGPHYLTGIGRKTGDAAQATFTVTTPWMEFGYGAAHLGLNPYENTLTTSNVSSLGVLWSVTGPGGGGTLAAVPGRVIAGGTSGIRALNNVTGAVIWNKLTTEAFDASPAVSGANTYIGSLSGTFYALNTSSGATVWSKKLDPSTIYSSAVVVGNVVYVAGLGGTVYALNATTGVAIWSYSTGGQIDSSPSVASGILYIGCYDGKLYALNATTGSLVWSFATGGAVESSPAVANGTVYVGSDDANVYAVQAGNGALVWKTNTGGSVYEAPAVANGSVFIGTNNNTMYSLNAHSGTVQWSASTSGIVSGTTVANGVVYATSRDGTAYAFAAVNGGILATGTLGYEFLGSPSVSDGVLYINAFNGNITAIALQAGTGAVAAAQSQSAIQSQSKTVTKTGNINAASALLPSRKYPPAISSLHPDYSLKITH